MRMERKSSLQCVSEIDALAMDATYHYFSMHFCRILMSWNYYPLKTSALKTNMALVSKVFRSSEVDFRHFVQHFQRALLLLLKKRASASECSVRFE